PNPPRTNGPNVTQPKPLGSNGSSSKRAIMPPAVYRPNDNEQATQSRTMKASGPSLNRSAARIPTVPSGMNLRTKPAKPIMGGRDFWGRPTNLAAVSKSPITGSFAQPKQQAAIRTTAIVRKEPRVWRPLPNAVQRNITAVNSGSLDNDYCGGFARLVGWVLTPPDVGPGIIVQHVKRGYKNVVDVNTGNALTELNIKNVTANSDRPN